MNKRSLESIKEECSNFSFYNEFISYSTKSKKLRLRCKDNLLHDINLSNARRKKSELCMKSSVDKQSYVKMLSSKFNFYNEFINYIGGKKSIIELRCKHGFIHSLSLYRAYKRNRELNLESVIDKQNYARCVCKDRLKFYHEFLKVENNILYVKCKNNFIHSFKYQNSFCRESELDIISVCDVQKYAEFLSKDFKFYNKFISYQEGKNNKQAYGLFTCINNIKHKITWQGAKNKITELNVESAINKNEYIEKIFSKTKSSQNGDKFFKYIKGKCNGNNQKIQLKCKYGYLHVIDWHNILGGCMCWKGSLVDKSKTKEYEKLNPYCPYKNTSPNYLKASNKKKKSSPNTFFNLYLLECKSKLGEVFYQIGVTWLKLTNRHGSKTKITKSSPYTWKLLDIITTKDNVFICECEDKLNDILKNSSYRYNFKQKHGYIFGGHTECFKKEHRALLITKFKQFKDVIL